jgi:hypothetical protein
VIGRELACHDDALEKACALGQESHFASTIHHDAGRREPFPTKSIAHPRTRMCVDAPRCRSKRFALALCCDGDRRITCLRGAQVEARGSRLKRGDDRDERCGGCRRRVVHNNSNDANNITWASLSAAASKRKRAASLTSPVVLSAHRVSASAHRVPRYRSACERCSKSNLEQIAHACYVRGRLTWSKALRERDFSRVIVHVFSPSLDLAGFSLGRSLSRVRRPRP